MINSDCDISKQDGHVRPFRRDKRRNLKCRLSEECVAAVFAIPAGDLRRRSRGAARSAFARQVAMYLAHVGLGLTLTEVGAGFRRDRTTVAHACAVVEDCRDDPEFDRLMGRLEGALLLMREIVPPSAERAARIQDSNR
ncbi:MAG: helix-turn-helix domain-containing protein [Pseudomonadota bacterium]|nr:helix-turn-helix domain-containing protein [Pseudomonadota bacterium]